MSQLPPEVTVVAGLDAVQALVFADSYGFGAAQRSGDDYSIGELIKTDLLDPDFQRPRECGIAMITEMGRP